MCNSTSSYAMVLTPCTRFKQQTILCIVRHKHDSPVSTTCLLSAFVWQASLGNWSAFTNRCGILLAQKHGKGSGVSVYKEGFSGQRVMKEGAPPARLQAGCIGG